MKEITLKELLEGCREKRFDDCIFLIDAKSIYGKETMNGINNCAIFNLFNHEFVVQPVPCRWYTLIAIREMETFTELYDADKIKVPEMAYRVGNF